MGVSPGWLVYPTLISLNEVRWEICAMCLFSKLSVTNAAATLPPSHMFSLSPVLKKQIVCRAKLNLIASSSASQPRRSFVLETPTLGPAGTEWVHNNKILHVCSSSLLDLLLHLVVFQEEETNKCRAFYLRASTAVGRI